MNLIKISIFLSLLLTAGVMKGKENPDSLQKELRKPAKDTTRFNLFIRLGAYYKTVNPDSTYLYNKKAFALAETLKDETRKALALNGIAWAEYSMGKLDSAIITCDKALNILNTVKQNTTYFKSVKANVLTTKGTVLYAQGIYDKALDSQLSALKINEDVHNEQGQAANFGSIGVLYYIQKDHDKAREFYFRALKTFEKFNDVKAKCRTLSNIGATYLAQGNYAEALNYYNASNKIAREINYRSILALNSGNIGSIYGDKAVKLTEQCKCDNDSGYYKKAMENQLVSLEIGRETGEPYSIAADLLNIGELHFKQKNYSQAEKYYKESFKIGQETGIADMIKEGYSSMSKLYEVKGNPSEALKYYKLYTKLKDSLINDENHRQLLDQEYKFSYMKKAATDSVAFAKEKEVTQAKTEAQLEAARNRQMFLFGGLGLLALFGVIMFNRFKVTQKQKKIIEMQKLEVEQKQKEVTDSIKYAKRIQQALMPNEKYFEKHLKN